MAYIMQDVALNRTLTHVSFLIVTFCLYVAFMIGYNSSIEIKLLKQLFSSSLIILGIVLSIHIINQYRIVSEYTKANDDRIVYLTELKLKGQTELVELDPLPPSGFLHSAEITTDAAFEQNQHFKNGLFLNFQIRVKENK